MAEHNKYASKRFQLNLVSPTKYDWTNVAKSIVGGGTPYDKAKAVYLWIIENITYDTSYSIYDSDTAWKERKGVCQAYCELFYRIGTAAGLDVRIISGHGRINEAKPKITENHCWIVVNKQSNTHGKSPFPETIIYEEGDEEKSNPIITEGLNRDTAILIEPTWGAGI